MAQLRITWKILLTTIAAMLTVTLVMALQAILLHNKIQTFFTMTRLQRQIQREDDLNPMSMLLAKRQHIGLTQHTLTTMSPQREPQTHQQLQAIGVTI